MLTIFVSECIHSLIIIIIRNRKRNETFVMCHLLKAFFYVVAWKFLLSSVHQTLYIIYMYILLVILFSSRQIIFGFGPLGIVVPLRWKLSSLLD